MGRYGGVAIRSAKDYDPEKGDISDWLLTPNNRPILGPKFLPEGYFHERVRGWYQDHHQTIWEAYPPLLGRIKLCKKVFGLEITDVLLTATISTPIIENLRLKGHKNLGRPEKLDLDQANITKFTISCSQKCTLTIDSAPRPLIGSITYIASNLGFRIGRSQNEKHGIHKPGKSDRIYD